MDNIISTKSIGFGIAEVEEAFILSEEPMSRLIFRALIHKKGIRGQIIRQRRESKNDVWIPDKKINIRTLEKNEGINLDINTAAVTNLYYAILKLANILKEHGIEYGKHEYAVVNPETVIITESNKTSYIKKIIDAGYNEDVWEYLTESNPSLATKLSYARIHDIKQKTIEELSSRLQAESFHETSGDDSWQKWIYRNNWLFGVNYKKPIEKTKINITGIMPDFVFPTLDGFVDILEIKLPDDNVISEDSSHPGSWKWTSETNKSIGQVVNYLCEIDRLSSEIERNIEKKYRYEISFLKPRAFILIGNSTFWNPDKKEGLRKMNNVLHGIEVLTYKDLLDRGKQAININILEQN